MAKKIGGRKFILTLFVILLAFVLLLIDKIKGDQFLDFVLVVAGVYTAGNVVSKFTIPK